MLKQEMDSYIIIIWECAQNKDDNKQSEDNWEPTWVISEKLQNLKFVKQGMLVLRAVIF